MTPIPAPNGESQTREQSEVGSDSLLTPEMRAIIHGSEGKDKKAEYEASLKRWWTEYADRKNDEDDEYVANSLLYDRNHLPRTAPPPDCCQTDLAKPSDSKQAEDNQ